MKPVPTKRTRRGCIRCCSPRGRAVGRSLGEILIEEPGVSVAAIRRREVRVVSPGPETVLQAGA